MVTLTIMLKSGIYILFAVLITGSLNFAQSGRAITTQSNEDTVKTLPQTDETICEKDLKEFEEIRFVQLEEFIKRLNHLGNCGYRLNQVVRIVLDSDKNLNQMAFSALLRKDGANKYEYAWFIATDPGRAQTLANKYAESGFYFRESMSFVYGRCTEFAEKQKRENDKSGGLGDIFNVKIGQMGSFFLFEKKSGDMKKNEYRILDARITGKEGELETNKKKLDDYVLKGFRPVDLWYTGEWNEHFVVMEKDESVKPQGEYIFLSAYYDMHKKLKELGRQGYKLMFTGLAFALLHRTSEEPLNIEYDSFDLYKDIKKKSRKWNGKNVSYITTGISGFFIHCDPFDGKLFVALSPKTATNDKDTIFLVRSEFIDDYFKRKDLKPTKKNPLTKEQIREMDYEFFAKINDLVKEGYELVNFSMPNAEVYVFEKVAK